MLIFDDTTLEVHDQEVSTTPYTIDYSKEPIWLDFTFDDGKVRCILEFSDADTLRVTGERENLGPRPSSFEAAHEVMTFRRKK
jgi:uncharacterized protein (TIGR03067 family)